MRQPPSSPVSFPVNVARLPQKGLSVTIEADARQRKRLAEQHGVLEVRTFRVDAVVSKWKRNGVRVDGKVEAAIQQECVVTLEPLEATIFEEFSQVYLPEDSKLGRLGFGDGGEIHLDAEGPDSPETFSGDTIDVGAMAEEFFELAIDPYPRKPGAALTSSADMDEDDGGSPLREKLLSFTRKQ